MGNYLIFAIGFLAQIFFSARILFQWLLSERERRVVSPTIYWVLSIFGAYLLFAYGWMREDFAIILGQMISYYVYIWNLHLKGVWKRIPAVVKGILLCTPPVAILMVLRNLSGFLYEFFLDDDIPMYIIVYGSLGQFIFTLRFIYQWYFSYKLGKSVLPAGFWVISLIGSGIIISYAFYRWDPVLLLGQSAGFIAYSRNLEIGYRQKRRMEKKG